MPNPLFTTLILLSALASAPLAAETPTAVFGFEIYDTSGEGRNPEHDARLAMASALLRDALDTRAGYNVISLDRYADAIAEAGYLEGCNGCELPLARAAGAQWSVRGLVHKVSTLILYLRITVTDAHTGTVIREASAGIRGDNDRAWQRGILYLVDNALTPAP